MEKLLVKISDYLASSAALDEDQKEIIFYALQLIYSGIGGIVAIIIVSWLAGVLAYAVIAAFANAYLRVKAGGGHASFPMSCFTIGAIIFTVIGLIAKFTPDTILNDFLLLSLVPIYIITLWILLKYAPADTPAKPLSEDRKKVLKGKTIRGHLLLFIVIILILFIQRQGFNFTKSINLNYIFAALLGIIWETFTVTPAGYMVIDFLDKIMVKILKPKFI